jgi:hypothetical protein
VHCSEDCSENRWLRLLAWTSRLVSDLSLNSFSTVADIPRKSFVTPDQGVGVNAAAKHESHFV